MGEDVATRPAVCVTNEFREKFVIGRGPAGPAGSGRIVSLDLTVWDLLSYRKFSLLTSGIAGTSPPLLSVPVLCCRRQSSSSQYDVVGEGTSGNDYDDVVEASEVEGHANLKEAHLRVQAAHERAKERRAAS